MKRTINAFGALVLIATAAFFRPAHAQFTNTTHSASHSAMGGSVIYNFDERYVGLDYRQGFLMASMADKSLRAMWPTGKIGTVVANYMHHGNVDYHEQQLMAGYAIRATNRLHVGVAASYLNLGTSDGHYAPQQWLAASVQLRTNFSDNCALTLTTGTRPWDKMRPYRLHLQTIYRPLPQLLTVIEGESEERMRMRLGMEYCYEERFFLRTGMATHPMIFTFGLGMRQKHYAIDLAVEVHNRLGITPHSSLTLWF